VRARFTNGDGTKNAKSSELRRPNAWGRSSTRWTRLMLQENSNFNYKEWARLRLILEYTTSTFWMTSGSKSTRVTPITALSHSPAVIQKKCKSIKLRFSPHSVVVPMTVRSKNSYFPLSQRQTKSLMEETWMIQRLWGKESKRCRKRLANFRQSSRTQSPRKNRGQSLRNSASNQVPRRQPSSKRLAKPKLRSRSQSASSEVEPEPAILFNI